MSRIVHCGECYETVQLSVWLDKNDVTLYVRESADGYDVASKPHMYYQSAAGFWHPVQRSHPFAMSAAYAIRMFAGRICSVKLKICRKKWWFAETLDNRNTRVVYDEREV